MTRRLEDELRRRIEAMYEASTPVEELLPAGFDGREDGDPERTDEIVLIPGLVRRQRISGWVAGLAAAAVVLLFAVPLVLLTDAEEDVANLTPPSATTPTTTSATITQTLYADGTINCPDLIADDTTYPAGQITYTPLPGGVEIHIVLENAAPDWPYIVYVQKPNTVDCGIGLDEIPLTTDTQGHGELTHVLPLFDGEHSIGINISYDNAEPPDPRHREISTDSYATFTVPESTDR